MAMTLSFHENLDYADSAPNFEVFSTPFYQPAVTAERIHLFSDKMRAPKFENQISRPRLIELLGKHTEQFGATLITGRAATGKTALAAEFAGRFKRVAWYQIDSAEADWNLFARYFAAIFEEDFAPYEQESREILVFVEKLLGKAAQKSKEPLLIVLDDVHNVFDAEWFTEFFVSLLYSLTPEMKLVMLSRAKPPQPLWRVRSKQVLGVIDEKLLSFNLDETRQFFKKHRIGAKTAEAVHRTTFGRISRLKKLLKN